MAWSVADDQLVFQAGLANSASKVVSRKVCIWAGVMVLTLAEDCEKPKVARKSASTWFLLAEPAV